MLNFAILLIAGAKLRIIFNLANNIEDFSKKNFYFAWSYSVKSGPVRRKMIPVWGRGDYERKKLRADGTVMRWATARS